MEETKELQVKVSREFIIDIEEIYEYGNETFGIKHAKDYEEGIWQLVERLSNNYLLFPECRHLPTKSKMYRWIILESHLLIYRIMQTEVQVLRILHSKRSVNKIKQAKSIRL